MVFVKVEDRISIFAVQSHRYVISGWMCLFLLCPLYVLQSEHWSAIRRLGKGVCPCC
jgi:hypothetical protein